MEWVHNASHLGINRTLDMVSARYYWPGLTTDVKNYVSNIIVCYLAMGLTKFTVTGGIM